MREISEGHRGKELQKTGTSEKTGARAMMRQAQGPASTATNRSLSRDQYAPRRRLSTVWGRIAQLFDCCFGAIARVLADHDCVSAVESKVSEPPQSRDNPPIVKQPLREIIDGPPREPANISANVTYESALLALSALFPPEAAVRVTQRTPEQASNLRAGNRDASTTGSIQKVSAASRHRHRNNNSPAITTSSDRHPTSLAKLNPKALLTFRPTKKDT